MYMYVHPYAPIAQFVAQSPRLSGKINYALGRATEPANWLRSRGVPVPSFDKYGEAPKKLMEYGPYATGRLQEEMQQADGGRIERRAGGRVTHEDKADQLIAAADRAKRHINRKTEPLLQTPDEAVAKALAVANQAIGD